MGKKTFKRKITVSLACILVPIIILLLFYNFYSIHVYNKKIAQSNHTSLSIYKNHMQKNLKEVENYLAEKVGNDYCFNRLRAGEGALDAYGDAWEITENLKSNMAMQEITGGYILLSKKNQIERAVFTKDFSYSEQLVIRNKLNACLEDEGWEVPKKWGIMEYEAEDNAVLFRIMGNRDTCIISIINLRSCLPDSEAGDSSFFTFADENNKPLLEGSLLDKMEVELQYNQEGITYSGNPMYMIIGEKIAGTGLSMKMLTANSGYMSNLNQIQIILLVISLLTVLIIPVSFWWMNQYIVRPLQNISHTMESIKDGNLNEKMEEDFGIQEYHSLIGTFNGMMEQIKRSKIEAYENEIEKKHAQLQYLQLQIRPHFFLNCLKLLYAMVECQNYDKFREMIMAISNHLRYTFKDNLSLVPLQLELEHVKNYIRIQQLSTNYKIEHEIYIEPEFLDFKVPTLIMETFVENSFKYGIQDGKELVLRIFAGATEDGRNLQIKIEDNGRGFQEGLLRELQEENQELFRENCVGIANVKHRLSIIYGDKASVQFKNMNPGASVMITFTLDEY